MLRAEMESCLKLSENLVFDDRLVHIEMSDHHVMVQYVIDVLRGSVNDRATSRAILWENGGLGQGSES